MDVKEAAVRQRSKHLRRFGCRCHSSNGPTIVYCSHQKRGVRTITRAYDDSPTAQAVVNRLGVRTPRSVCWDAMRARPATMAMRRGCRDRRRARRRRRAARRPRPDYCFRYRICGRRRLARFDARRGSGRRREGRHHRSSDQHGGRTRRARTITPRPFVGAALSFRCERMTPAPQRSKRSWMERRRSIARRASQPKGNDAEL